MRTSPIRDLLASEGVFGDLGPDDVDLLAGCGRNEVFEAGALLAREGERADRFFVVRQGRLALELPAAGRPLVVDTSGPAEVVGWSWLFPPHRWTADVRAVERTHVVAIDGACLRDKCDAEPAFGYRMMSRFAQLMIERLDAMRLQLLDLYGGTHVG